MTARSAGAIPADAARRGAVDIADHAGPGVLPDDPPSPVGLWRDRSPRGGARWADDDSDLVVYHRRAQRGGGVRGQHYASNGWNVLPVYVPTVGRPTAFRVQTLGTVRTERET